MDNHKMKGLSEVRQDAEDMKTGAAVYKGIGSKPSQLHVFNPDAPIELVKTDKENLVQTVKTEFNRDPEFKQRLIKELNVEPVDHSDGLLPPMREQSAEQAIQELK
jgi:hypothetical protein